MIPVNAVLGSAAVPPAGETWKGEICAVYQRSAHLRAEGRYLTLGEPTLAPHPYSILWRRFSSAAMLGMPCLVTPQGLAFGNGDRLDFGSMPRFTPVERCEHTTSAQGIREAIGATLAEALEYGDRNKLLLLAAGHAASSPRDTSSVARALRLRGKQLVRTMSEALAQRDKSLFVIASEAMAGFGEGLTPSGDDLLAGVYAALRFHHHSGKDTPFTPDEVEQTADATSQGTSAFSGFLMQSAARGLIALPLADWLDSAHQGDAAAAGALVRDIARLGHSSGLDCLGGMILALQISLGGASWIN